MVGDGRGGMHCCLLLPRQQGCVWHSALHLGLASERERQHQISVLCSTLCLCGRVSCAGGSASASVGLAASTPAQFISLLSLTAPICHPIPTLTAAKEFAPARWHIKGLTWRKAQPFVPAAQRHSMKLAVFVKVGCSPVVVVASQHSSSQEQHKAGSSSRAASSANIDWSGERYSECVRQALLGGNGGSGAGTRSAKLQLVHDLDSAHTSSAFKRFASTNGIEVVQLPAKAPDLDPLDYGVFGPVKRAWEKQVWADRLSWDAQCQLLIRLVEAYNPTAAIKALPSRIEQCIQAKGWHFEG